MRFKNCLKIGLFTLLVSCTNSENSKPNYIIELDEFLELYQDDTIKIIDFRHPNTYEKNHIEGALNIWRPDIEDASYPYEGIMASKQQIEILFSNLGIRTTDTLLVYDDRGLCEATRLWWVLQQYGFSNIKMLNGGYTTLVNNKIRQNKVQPKLKETKFHLPKRVEYKHRINKEDLLSALSSEINLIDTRTESEYKTGRIPGSILMDWINNIDYDSTKKIKTKEQLEILFGKHLNSKTDTVIVYCHSGVRSAHTTFVLTQILGYKNVLNYDGSWIEWSYFDDYPIEVEK